ncbi:signal transduction histidine kinase [Flavobacterium sp. 103]|uniref:tetratricopeptide repeat-containing sensor histidine kinase n=1 Tax=unclassified Flavobacterium TaxID=196869 RepID=UPI000D5D1A6C|nr:MULTISPECIES: tetratricopeptide repeat-containing sensor histidine kinase [unclassified Flavobacterium]PVX44892.1 signal transduction histidine kinase [Flavobacterium sp. 103]QKJ62967.1 tetratricopeptide repeat protein [Flavobacterium sp. M31R6]
MIQKTTQLLLFFIFSTVPAQAQNPIYKTIDSLKIALNQTKEDSDKTVLLTKLSSYSEYIGPDEAIKYAKKALYYAQKTKNEQQIGQTYGNLGTAYEIKSDYAHALKNLYKALAIYENLNDVKSLTTVYNNIGLIYIDLKNYKQGLIFYNKALQLSYQSKKERNVSLLLNNIGDVYLQKKEYPKALNYFYKALIINKKLDDTEGIGLNLSNIGICYINLKNYEKGIEMLNKSIATYDDHSNLYNNYNTYDLGRAYYLMSQDEKYKKDKKALIDRSISLFENALQIFKKYKSLKDIQETYLYLSKTNKSKGNYEVALDCFEKHSRIKDSIFSKESEKKLANLEFQREIDLRDKQIEIQTLRINSDSRKVYFLITIATAVAALLGLFLFLYDSKRRNNLLLKEKNTLISNINSQKDKFYSIIAHDLRGPFNGFLGLTELMAEDIDMMSAEDIKFAAVNMRSSAKNLFALLENLLEWSRMEQGLIPFVPKEHPLKSTLLDSIITLQDNADKKGISITTTISNSATLFADKNMFQAIIRNIVLNAIKFTPKKGSVNIQEKEDLYNTVIIVKDTGIGMNPKTVENLFKLDVQNNRVGTEEEPSTGLGLILCKEFIEKHKGKIWVESEEGKGSTFYISFPNKNSSLI